MEWLFSAGNVERKRSRGKRGRKKETELQPILSSYQRERIQRKRGTGEKENKDRKKEKV